MIAEMGPEMNMSKPKNFRRLICVSLSTLFIVAIPATSVLGLPTGYREDFNGCSQHTNLEERKTCCQLTKTQCNSQCDTLHTNKKLGPGGWIICGLDCDDANKSCVKGDEIEKRIDWPGQPGIQIPGVFVDDDRIVSDKGFTLNASTTSVVIEIQVDKGREETSTCMAAVATCNCPAKII